MDWQTVIIVALVVAAIGMALRLRRLESRIDLLLERTGRVGDDPVPGAEVSAMARQGDTIGAIRLYRQQSGADLRTARRVVEGLRER